MTVMQLLGLATFGIACGCMLLAFFLALFFSKSDREMARDWVHKFMGDGLHLGMTAIFGLNGLFMAPTEYWQVAYAVRVLVLVYFAYALWRFIKHVKRVKDRG